MDSSSLLLHPRTKTALDTLIARPPQTVLIAAGEGAGKKSLAYKYVAAVLGGSNEDLSNNPSVRIIQQDSIGIDDIRKIVKFTQLTTVGTAAIRRAVIIVNAQRMTTEAQNALLKILEEPPRDTIFVLTASPAGPLLDTVLSRAQQLTISPPNLKEVLSFYASLQNISASEITKFYHIAGGHMGLLSRLIHEPDHPYVVQIQKAKKILGMDMFERMLLVNELSKNKSEALSTLAALNRVSHAALSQAVASASPQLLKWRAICEQCDKALTDSQYNPNLKLVFSHLFLQMQ